MALLFLSPLFFIVLLSTCTHTTCTNLKISTPPTARSDTPARFNLHPRTAAKNVTFSTCSTDNHCEGTRGCKDPSDKSKELCTAGSNCFCFPDSFTYCTKSADCTAEGEVCLTTGISPPICGAQEFVSPPNSDAVENKTKTVAHICERANVTMEGTVKSGDACTYYESTSCPTGMTCVDISVFPTACCGPNSTVCRCFRLDQEKCGNTGDCPNGEVCARVLKGPPHCFTEEYLNSIFDERNFETIPDGDPEFPFCVHAEALSHMQPDDLVFAQHRRAAVLCDREGSCATAGHMVTWNGRPMAMRTYCTRHAANGCYRRVALVNSPRYKRQLRVKSRTAGLQYTALAARYATKVEEAILATAVHMGV